MNGRREMKLQNSYRYKEEWYLECGKEYNDHGDVRDEIEVAYKMMYEALKKVIYGHFQCNMVTNKDIMVTCCDINLTCFFIRLNYGHLFGSYGHISGCYGHFLLLTVTFLFQNLNYFFKEWRTRTGGRERNYKYNDEL